MKKALVPTLITIGTGLGLFLSRSKAPATPPAGGGAAPPAGGGAPGPGTTRAPGVLFHTPPTGTLALVRDSASHAAANMYASPSLSSPVATTVGPGAYVHVQRVRSDGWAIVTFPADPKTPKASRVTGYMTFPSLVLLDGTPLDNLWLK